VTYSQQGKVRCLHTNRRSDRVWGSFHHSAPPSSPSFVILQQSHNNRAAAFNRSGPSLYCLGFCFLTARGLGLGLAGLYRPFVRSCMQQYLSQRLRPWSASNASYKYAVIVKCWAAAQAWPCDLLHESSTVCHKMKEKGRFLDG
jgi:hypothetical protein